MYWTGFTHGTMNALSPGGKPRVIASGLPGLNSLALDARGRLFGTQVFLGDALWEFDPAGKAPPRLVKKDLGGLNGFDFGPDGRLCGPLWFRKQVVCLDVDSGAMEVVAEGLVQPAAANFNSRGELFAIDNETGEIFRIDIAARRRERVAQAPTNLDNLAFDAADRLYVTNMSDNAIYAIDPAGGWRAPCDGRRAQPARRHRGGRRHALRRRCLHAARRGPRRRRSARHQPLAGANRLPERRRRLRRAHRDRQPRRPVACSCAMPPH
jgi:sugar lactone lactonase YvrE